MTSSSQTKILLSLKAVDKRFGGLHAIQNVSFDLPAGQITTLVGPNGAGKTTLFNLITGHLQPNTGSISWMGESIENQIPWRIARKGIGRTFQDLRLFNQMTVLENIQTVMEKSIWLWQKKVNFERINIILEETGLNDVCNIRAIDLSYAQRKFLSLARIMAGDASLWLLDEPASGLDPVSFQLFMKLLKQYAAKGITICIIEHNLDIVTQLSDQLIFLDQGSVLAIGDPHEILQDPHLAAIYFGDRT